MRLSSIRFSGWALAVVALAICLWGNFLTRRIKTPELSGFPWLYAGDGAWFQETAEVEARGLPFAFGIDRYGEWNERYFPIPLLVNIAFSIVVAVFALLIWNSLNEKYHRRKFQIHLSTILVLTFSAGLLLWNNIRPSYQRTQAGGEGYSDLSVADSEKVAHNHTFTRYRNYGWPIQYWTTADGVRPENGKWIRIDEWVYCNEWRGYHGKQCLAFDLAVMFAFVAGLGGLLECVAGKRTPSPAEYP